LGAVAPALAAAVGVGLGAEADVNGGGTCVGRGGVAQAKNVLARLQRLIWMASLIERMAGYSC